MKQCSVLAGRLVLSKELRLESAPALNCFSCRGVIASKQFGGAAIAIRGHRCHLYLSSNSYVRTSNADGILNNSEGEHLSLVQRDSCPQISEDAGCMLSKGSSRAHGNKATSVIRDLCKWIYMEKVRLTFRIHTHYSFDQRIEVPIRRSTRNSGCSMARAVAAIWSRIGPTACPPTGDYEEHLGEHAFPTPHQPSRTQSLPLGRPILSDRADWWRRQKSGYLRRLPSPVRKSGRLQASPEDVFGNAPLRRLGVSRVHTAQQVPE